TSRSPSTSCSGGSPCSSRCTSGGEAGPASLTPPPAVPTIHLARLRKDRIAMGLVVPGSATRHSGLVVDDSNLLRGILKEELEAEGFEVHLAEDGPEALEKARDLRPDVILLDIGLPGMNGYEVCRQVKGDAATSDIPVLMI